MFHTTVKCVDCGTVMVDVPGNTKRCAVCRVGHNRENPFARRTRQSGPGWPRRLHSRSRGTWTTTWKL